MMTQQPPESVQTVHLSPDDEINVEGIDAWAS